MSTDRRIKGLKTRQKSLLASFNLIKSFVDTYDEETGACEVPVRLESLDALWTDFKQVQAELESLNEATIDDQLKQRTDFETAYYRVKGFILSMNKIPSSPRTNTSSSSSSQFLGSSSHVRLPDVKLPVFSGNLDDWLNFHDLFVSLVHSSHELSNIQKFYYLRSSLAGDALKLIQTVPLSANNYPVAWNLLVDHFQNTARLKQSYLDALFEFPSLKRESAADLHSLVEKFEANVKVLKQLGEKTEFWDIILIRMLSIRLDPTTRRDWEEYSSTKDAIAFQDLTSFIQRRVTVLQTIQGKPVETPASTQQFKKPAQRPIASHGASQINVGRKCIFCSDLHPLYMCSSFSKLDVEAKESEVRRHQLCRNCLRTGHHAQDCSSSSSCRKCRGHHHTQLCTGENTVAANSRTSTSSQPEAPTASTSGQPKASVSATVREPASYASTGHAQQNVILATAVVKLVDDNGTAHLARALLDSGSECCFITESFSKLVKAQRQNISVPISGIGQSSSHARYKIVSTIRSRVSDYSTSAEFLVLPKVTIDPPTASFDTSSWQFPPGIHLADPSFHEAKHIDIVIGAEIFFELFKVPGRIPLGDSLPTLVNSVLGWVVSGKVSQGTPTKLVISNVALVAGQHWTTEEDATPSSVEQATEHILRTSGLTIENRHIVHLPLKDEDGKEALDEAERRPTTICPASSIINLLYDQGIRIAIESCLFVQHWNQSTTINTQLIAEEWKQLAQIRLIPSKLYLRWFYTFLSTNQPICTEDRLNQPEPIRRTHQRIFSASQALSTALVRSFDAGNLHVARQLFVTVLHLRHWFIGARKPVKPPMKSYIVFLKTHQNHLKQPIVEYAHRRAAPVNGYIACFPCFSAPAIHIELNIRMSITLLQALRRFGYHRGLLNKGYAETSSNFIEDTIELWKQVRSKEIQPATTVECTSNLIHRQLGGLLKDAIRFAQKHFTRVLGYQIQPQNDMETLLTQIVNHFTACPFVRSHLESLTHDHFHLGHPLKVLADIIITEIPLNGPWQWQQTQSFTSIAIQHLKHENSSSMSWSMVAMRANCILEQAAAHEQHHASTSNCEIKIVRVILHPINSTK